jgi:ketosteroid isomerase-like protein
MTMIAEVTLRGVSPAEYDALRDRARWLEDAPAGGLAHLTWWEGADCHNIDAWESEEACAAFGEQRLAPAMAALGITQAPEVTVHDAHEVFVPRARTVAPTAGTVDATDNVALIRHGYEMFAARDIPGVLGMFDEAITWYSPDTVRYGGRYEGPQGVGSFFATLGENYAELRVEPSTFVDGGDTVVASGHHRGTSRAGVAFEVPFVHIWTFRAGRATSFTEYFDTAALNAALDPTGVRAASPRSTVGAAS